MCLPCKQGKLIRLRSLSCCLAVFGEHCCSHAGMSRCGTIAWAAALVAPQRGFLHAPTQLTKELRQSCSVFMFPVSGHRSLLGNRLCSWLHARRKRFVCVRGFCMVCGARACQPNNWIEVRVTAVSLMFPAGLPQPPSKL